MKRLDLNQKGKDKGRTGKPLGKIRPREKRGKRERLRSLKRTENPQVQSPPRVTMDVLWGQAPTTYEQKVGAEPETGLM
jgi:hypothetical protein